MCVCVCVYYTYIHIHIQYTVIDNITIQGISSCPPPEQPPQQHTVYE